ncbi:MAG: hypothetical protein ABIG39_00570 [Candidatus Micrarchaeota archaeon]
MLYSESQKTQKKKETKGFDVQAADDFAQGLRTATSSHDYFLRAVGETRGISKKEHDRKTKQEDSEFVKKTLKNHEKKVKTELKAIKSSRRVVLIEGIFGKKKAEKDEKDKGKENKKKDEKEEND